ncbi:hypothetical protein SISNIDRAFT_458274 [Sistotremastrum niveocremeum HHB9708]|uniref:Uncharacterized protein n=1 Tax=Sistotremastrum niveocremeum HHB9708 TaxID=1314777 RepID=A0A164QTD4_9AGAM|nr:hypothetical protein SISNIDRAFT_458270 [Sistotremastrum niveocremeum HHB9708]KZS89950.1 hypothetical protein SISNIDRAFT_458274 [Sistotremastrum niveocremeum HHB9708]
MRGDGRNACRPGLQAPAPSLRLSRNGRPPRTPLRMQWRAEQLVPMRIASTIPF